MYELVLVGPVTGNSGLIMIFSSSQHVPTPTRGEIYDDELGLALLHEGRPLVLRFDELHVFRWILGGISSTSSYTCYRIIVALYYFIVGLGTRQFGALAHHFCRSYPVLR